MPNVKDIIAKLNSVHDIITEDEAKVIFENLSRILNSLADSLKSANAMSPTSTKFRATKEDKELIEAVSNNIKKVSAHQKKATKQFYISVENYLDRLPDTNDEIFDKLNEYKEAITKALKLGNNNIPNVNTESDLEDLLKALIPDYFIARIDSATVRKVKLPQSPPPPEEEIVVEFGTKIDEPKDDPAPKVFTKDQMARLYKVGAKMETSIGKLAPHAYVDKDIDPKEVTRLITNKIVLNLKGEADVLHIANSDPLAKNKVNYQSTNLDVAGHIRTIVSDPSTKPPTITKPTGHYFKKRDAEFEKPGSTKKNPIGQDTEILNSQNKLDIYGEHKHTLTFNVSGDTDMTTLKAYRDAPGATTESNTKEELWSVTTKRSVLSFTIPSRNMMTDAAPTDAQNAAMSFFDAIKEGTSALQDSRVNHLIAKVYVKLGGHELNDQTKITKGHLEKMLQMAASMILMGKIPKFNAGTTTALKDLKLDPEWRSMATLIQEFQTRVGTDYDSAKLEDAFIKFTASMAKKTNIPAEIKDLLIKQGQYTVAAKDNIGATLVKKGPRQPN